MKNGRTEAAGFTDVGIYYAVAVGLAVLVALLSTRPGWTWVLALYMFTPLVALVAMHLLTGGNGWRRFVAELGLGKPGFSGWPFALLVPPLILALATLAAVATGVVHVAVPPDAPSLLVWTAMLLAEIAIGCVFAFGEEVGWRGWLLMRLLALGVWPAMLVTGFLHALWHLPVMLLTTHYMGAGSPWLVVPGFLALLTLGGVGYGYLRLSTGSLWPVVIFHATFNAVLVQTRWITTTTNPATASYLGGESGIFTILAAAVMALAVARFWHAGQLRPA